MLTQVDRLGVSQKGGGNPAWETTAPCMALYVLRFQGALNGGDAPDLGELPVFDMRAHQRFRKLIAFAAAAAHVELVSNVFHGSGAGIECSTNRSVGDVMAYANDHGDAPPLWARRCPSECR